MSVIHALMVLLALPGGGWARPHRPGPEIHPARMRALRGGLRFHLRAFRGVRARNLRRRALAPPRLIQRAVRLAPHRAKALRELEDRVTPRWMRAQTELRIARMHLAWTLRDPESSPEAIRKALREVQAQEQKIREIQEETLLELRKALEGDAFSRLFVPYRRRGR